MTIMGELFREIRFCVLLALRTQIFQGFSMDRVFSSSLSVGVNGRREIIGSTYFLSLFGPSHIRCNIKSSVDFFFFSNYQQSLVECDRYICRLVFHDFSNSFAIIVFVGTYFHATVFCRSFL